METVFVAMSGGIDSSLTAYLLKKEGYKVVGITFQLLPASIRNIKNPKTCCSVKTIMDAKRIADTLSIPHYVINLRDEFHEFVIKRFVDEYRAGKTPNPCILCNQFIKFSSFFAKALSMGGDYIATGHYAKIEKVGEEYCLKRGTDRSKDQSYFLYPLKKECMGHVLFPLGGYRKSTVLSMARNMGWKGIDTYKESQDICFIPDGEYRSFLSGFIHPAKGPIYSVDGRLMGSHDGIHLYTIGQRRGLNIPYTEPLYVIETRPDENCLIVGSKKHLRRKRLTATSINLFSDTFQGVTGKVRYRQREQSCSYSVNNNIMTVDFDENIDAVTPGQSVVLYSQDTVVGGGVIENSSI